MPRLIFKDDLGKNNIYLQLDTLEIRGIGYLKNGNYYIKRDKDKHYFEYYKGYGYNKQLLDFLPQDTRLVLSVKGNQRLCYTAMASDIVEHNQTYKKEGFEPQYVYPFERMKIDLMSRYK